MLKEIAGIVVEVGAIILKASLFAVLLVYGAALLDRHRQKFLVRRPPKQPRSCDNVDGGS
jgi:hypothetical protein